MRSINNNLRQSRYHQTLWLLASLLCHELYLARRRCWTARLPPFLSLILGLTPGRLVPGLVLRVIPGLEAINFFFNFPVTFAGNSCQLSLCRMHLFACIAVLMPSGLPERFTAHHSNYHRLKVFPYTSGAYIASPSRHKYCLSSLWGARATLIRNNNNYAYDDSDGAYWYAHDGRGAGSE